MSRTCAADGCGEARYGSKVHCLTHARNVSLNGSPYISARPAEPMLDADLRCEVCTGWRGEWERTCSKTCENERVRRLMVELRATGAVT